MPNQPAPPDLSDGEDLKHLAGLPALVIRMDRKIEMGRGISLSSAELDLLVAAGGLGILRVALTKVQFEQSTRRLKARAAAGTGTSTEAARAHLSSYMGSSDHEHPAAVTPAPQRAYSVASLAAHWGCSDGLVRKLISSGELKSWRYGNLIRISKEAVGEFEAQGGSRNV